MCGLAGIVDYSQLEGFGNIETIIDNQTHRGPDHYGRWRSEEGTCVLGFNRLSIIDLTPTGHQPMIDQQTGNVIVFNGEIYNFLELRQKLQKAGEQFRSSSDTEVILAMYRKYGTDCVRHLRGMFAFAIWDALNHYLYVARDRVGQKPFNYSISNGRLIFASEIRPLVSYPSIDREMDLEALQLYLELQYIPAPWSIYRSVRKLLPGHWGIFNRDGFRTEKYWELDYTQKISIHSEGEALELLEDKIREAVRIRLISDVPLGSTLSGGVDSSLVVAMMAGLMDQPVQTFNIAFEEDAFDESPYARQVADLYGTAHHEYRLKSDIEELLPKLVKHYGEPYGDKGAVPAFYVSLSARQKVTVALNGDGGDELLGGYPRYKISRRALALLGNSKRWSFPASAIRSYSRMRSSSARLGKAVGHYGMRHLFPELRSLGPMSEYFFGGKLRAELVGGLATDVVLQWQLSRLMVALERADHAIDRMLWLDTTTYLRDDGLVKMDIAAMHCSLEARTPLVDHELIELCASLPPSIKHNPSTGKYLLKKLAEKYLPQELIYRQKQGFAIPVDAWLRGPLEPYVREIVLNPSLMEPLNMAVIQRLYSQFLVGGTKHYHRIWLLLLFGLWRQMDRDSI
jgi:asparagine synthase (glutamine-hydrolysing)